MNIPDTQLEPVEWANLDGWRPTITQRRSRPFSRAASHFSPSSSHMTQGPSYESGPGKAVAGRLEGSVA
jgi:hypothetical protein